jgi:hypothetical protein
MLQMNAAEQHNYPEPGGDQAILRETADLSSDEPEPARDPSWQINPPDYEFNGFIWGVIEIDGVQVNTINDVIGVFVGEECRGLADKDFYNSVVDYTNPFGHVAYMPMVYGDGPGDMMHFKYYDASSDQIFDVEETLEFVPDMVVGNGYDPFIFTVNTNSIEEEELPGTQVISCYPNPFNPEVSILFNLDKTGSTDLSIFNLRGQKIATLYNGILAEGNHIYTWDGRNDQGEEQSNGVYFYRLQANGVFKSGKMLMLK